MLQCLEYSLNAKEWISIFIGVKHTGQRVFEWKNTLKGAKRGFLMTMFHSFESENLTFALILG